MITVTRTKEHEQVRDARRDAGGEGLWLLFTLALAAGTVWLAWHSLDGVWSPLLWLVAGAVCADVLTGFRSVWAAVRDWRRMRRSLAFRLLMRELDESAQRAWQVYRAARRTEVEREQARRGGRR